MIHGGFWRARHGRKQSRPLCADLAARGWAAWNVEYRRLGDGGGFPRTLDDVAAAVDHLTEVPAHRPGVLDLSRVVAIGHSAGGHLAAWLATREAARVPVTGVVAQAGVLDLRMASALALSDGGRARAARRHARGAAGALRRSRRPPSGSRSASRRCVTHGDRDEIVPLAISEAFAAAARAAGDDVELVVAPGEDHFGHLDPGTRCGRR